MHDHSDQFEMASFHAADRVHYRICGRCGARTSPHLTESSCLEEARRYGWRRVAASERPGARRLDLCGHCAAEAGYGPPLARWE